MIVRVNVVTVNNSPIQDHVRPDDDSQPTYEMTLGSNFHKTYFDQHRYNLFRSTISVPFIGPLRYKPFRLYSPSDISPSVYKTPRI